MALQGQAGVAFQGQAGVAFQRRAGVAFQGQAGVAFQRRAGKVFHTRHRQATGLCPANVLELQSPALKCIRRLPSVAT